MEIQRDAWEVPSYTSTFFRPKSSNYAIVIPVLNEGERIRAQLSRMHEIGCDKLANVFIVDGGSNDGSLEPTWLASVGVRGLLVKTGPGKLGGQLRCAYAECLEQGYAGIITIDGNNKDNPQAIASFVDELRAGTQFVQGSRYVPGGAAINTPLSRHLALRWLHAPFLALASGFPWTDTTNGFRGYAREVLLDPRVAPFRDTFQTYELLAYLTARVPRLGYRCKEVPVERRYPDHGKIPTKISPWRGNWRLFSILLKAVCGGYRPPTSSQK